MPGDYPIITSDGLLVLQFDSHFRIWRGFEIECLGSLKLSIPLTVVIIATPMASITVSLLRDVMIVIDVFPFRWIVDIVVVVRVVYEFFPI